MTDENPFAAPTVADLSTEPRLSFLEQIAVFVTTFVAVVCTFFATCFGSIWIGESLDRSSTPGSQNSTLGIVIMIGIIIGLPLLSSAWVLSTVRRVMANALLEKKKAALKKSVASSDDSQT